MSIQQKKRSEIQAQYKWRLEDIFASDEQWAQACEDILSRLPALEAYNGRLASAPALAECLALLYDLSRRASLVVAYAHMRHHEDMSEPHYQAMKERSVGCAVKLDAAASFIEPEILSVGEDVTGALLAAEPVYEQLIQNLLRTRAHVRSAEVEQLLARAREVADAPEQIFSMIQSADMKFGNVTDENGREVELTHGRFISFMESQDRSVREAVFRQFYSAFTAQKNTLAAAYYGSVKADLFFARARGYETALDAALFGDNIPRSVCESLIAQVNNNLPQLHRYMALRKKQLGVGELHVYDFHVPLVKEADKKVAYDEAKDTILKALAPLGEEYCEIVCRGFDEGWIDVYENAHKHTGAYSWDGTYGVHPYVLLNYDNKLDDMFTLAHEMGHALHTHYASQAQPYIYSNYSIFAAEVASTVNEALLTHYLLETLTEPAQLAYITNHFLDQFRTTLFRQTLFAEFEMRTHEMVERDEPLTVENLCQIYRELNARYYGDQVVLDTETDIEWARIPHFYNAFYVYQYATGMSAALALTKKILTEGAPAVEAYIEFLKSGASEYPIDALRKAGADMTTAAPVQSAMERFSILVTKLEGLL